MRDLRAVFSALRRQGRSQYRLLSGCLFFSSLLITAFSMMMQSSTVQNTLPEGGDSRKQVMMIFVLVVIGCAALSIYAAGLFFRCQSREAGVFLALGFSRRALSRQLRRDWLRPALGACLGGLALGVPLCWLVWFFFRLTLVDTPEMTLVFDPKAYLLPAAFAGFVLTALAVMQRRFLARVNVLDILRESHRPEPVRPAPRRYGWGGILLIVLGGLLGYLVPGFCVQTLHWYPPGAFSALFYLPALIGLYQVLLYTVAGGWHRGAGRYAHLVETGMMRFQARQTVRNMLVVTVLTAGAYFAAFYIPLAVAPGRAAIAARPMDYQFFYRADWDMVDSAQIQALAGKYGLTLTDYAESPSASLAVDGILHMETDGPMGTTYREVPTQILSELRFLPVSGWNALTGDNLTLHPGESAATLNYYGSPVDFTLVTNPVTGQQLSVRTRETPLPSALFQDLAVLSDQDYEAITRDLTPEWREVQVVFNAENDSYPFAKELFHTIVRRSGSEAQRLDAYDRIAARRAQAEGEIYFLDPESPERADFPVLDPSHPDSSDFRMNWKYMPKFRVLDASDFLSTFAVYLLIFLFISLLCFAAVAVILYTRSQTLMLTNAWVYQDLHKLGASPAYLRQTARGQIKRVFLAPLVIGTLLILAFYLLILLGNGGDGVITPPEWLGLAVCLALTAGVSGLFYGLYRFTLRRAWRTLP